MKKFFQNIFLLLAAVLFTLLISEAVLFFLGLPKFYKCHSSPSQFAFYKRPGGSYFYTNIPSSDIKFIYDRDPRGYFGPENDISHVTNSWGFRGDDFFLTKPEKTFRIAVLGDSFTFGEGVDFKDIYSQKLVKLLKEKYVDEDIVFESYNFGVGGYNMEQTLLAFKEFALKTSPDAVVLGYTLNDAESPLFTLDASGMGITRRPREIDVREGLSDPLAPDSFIFRSRVARLIWKILRARQDSSKTIAHYDYLYSQGSPGWNKAKEALTEFIETCREYNIPCYVVCFPLLYSLDDNYPFGAIHELLRKEVASSGYSRAYFVDLFSDLKGKKYTDLWVHPTDQHPNEVVHDLAAKAIFNSLNDNLDPGRSP